MGNTRAGVIKLCLQSFLESFEKKGAASLPLDWQDILDSLDGRTVSSREINSEPSQAVQDALKEAAQGVANYVQNKNAKKRRAKTPKS